MRTKGKLSSWNDDKGFGFITPVAGGKKVFVHIKAFGNINRRPEINQLVTYAVSADRQGRPCAVNATLPGDRLATETARKGGSLALAVAGAFLVVVSVSVLAARIQPLVLAVYVIASLLTFIMYAADKSAARRGTWRISEKTLHVLSLSGGWPGAIVAQQGLRHKTKKQPFRSIFWITVVLNCGVFAWLFTAAGGTALNALISGVV